MSTKYGIQSLGFIGFLGFVFGLIGYLRAIAAHHAMLEAGDISKVRVLHIATIASEISLWGGLALMLISLLCYFLYRRWSRDDHDA